jgi:hypothetical protein
MGDNVHELPVARKQTDHENSGYSQHLREVAASIDAGNVTGLLMAVETNGEWIFTAMGKKFELVGILEGHKAKLLSGDMDVE